MTTFWLSFVLTVGLCSLTHASAVQELMYIEIVLSRRDVFSYVAILNLLWHLFTQVSNDGTRPCTTRAIYKNLFVAIGTVQEALISGFHGFRCRRCGRNNAQCLCDVVFRFHFGRFETLPMNVRRGENVKRVRHWLAGMPILGQRLGRRETGNSYLIPTLFQANLMKVVLYCCILDLGCTWYEFGLSGFIRHWLGGSEVSDFRMANLFYGWFNVHSHAAYIGESSVGYPGRFRSHVRAFLEAHHDTGLHKHAQYLYQQLLNHGLRWYAMIPLFIWRRVVPKVVRLEKEAQRSAAGVDPAAFPKPCRH